MKLGRDITEWLTTAALVAAVTMALPCLAQKNESHPAPPTQHNSTSAYQSHPAQAHPQNQPRGHAGDWLRRYKDLPPAEQERELQKDPGFRALPPARQQELRQRLQHFSSLSPQEQLRILNNMERWEHLTPGQKQQARQVFNQFRRLPPARKQMVATAVNELRNIPPDQRDRVIDSPRFRGMFSDQEREMIRGASRLPLAPPDGP